MSKKINFENPPIIELVIGVQFENSILNNNLIFEYYQKTKDKYPKIQENTILPSIVEKIEEPTEYNYIPGFNARRFFINEIGDRLIQIQPNKLLFNWRKTNDEKEYPNFDRIYHDFIEIYEDLVKFGDLEPEINQLELTYFDHISLEEFSLDSYYLDDIFKFWNLSEQLKHIDCKLVITKPKINGNLNFKVDSAVTKKDNKKVITTESTCRGKKNEEQSMKDWFNDSHEILLNFFLDITTDNAKNIWGMKK